MPMEHKFNLADFVDTLDQVDVAIRLAHAPNQPIVFSSFIKYIYQTRMLIDVPKQLGINHLLIPMLPLEIAFKKDPSHTLQITAQVVRYQETGQNGPGCWIEVPDSLKDLILKRRGHIRIPVTFPLKIRYQSGTHELVVNGESVNLSGGGLRFISRQQFAKGQHLILEFKADPRFEEFKLPAEVILSSPAPPRTSRDLGGFATAIKFIDLLPRYEDQLVGICFRRELEQKKHLQSN